MKIYDLSAAGKTNPIQTQFKANQTQSKANQTQFKPNQTQPVVSLSNLFQTQSNPTRSELVEPISKPIKPNL